MYLVKGLCVMAVSRVVAAGVSAAVLCVGVAGVSAAVSQAPGDGVSSSSVSAGPPGGDRHGPGGQGPARAGGEQLRELVDAVAAAGDDEARLNAANQLAAAVKALRATQPESGHDRAGGRDGGPGRDGARARPDRQLTAEQKAQLDAARQKVRGAFEELAKVRESLGVPGPDAHRGDNPRRPDPSGSDAPSR